MYGFWDPPHSEGIGKAKENKSKGKANAKRRQREGKARAKRRHSEGKAKAKRKQHISRVLVMGGANCAPTSLEKYIVALMVEVSRDVGLHGELMADNETLVSWRFDIDKFSDHLCEWVPAWVYYLDQDCANLPQLAQS